ncbi:membrane protein DedA with SNARE-associated domain [Tahibacter aquaticus]|uniref:Membrane protein DedA with SNARE-associated domain n=1 Tax=Tahibacter aquaticus TaxID=520092 RepID=A0A4R6Z2P8_9GAMM|nr:DedA family protein/thiosulfate sulfurtransferase GlpE [Tahibacter aquaticus]TDR45749.1 membrane protein DedA with SNARE-associated domain [Tahibacter aquaticus]
MRSFIALIELHGLPLVFLCVLLEQAGIPLPAYPVLLVAAALSAATVGGPLKVLAVAAIAALIADLAWYAAGRHYGSRVLGTLCRLSLSPDSCVRQTQSLYTRYGPPSLSFAKFVPGFASLATALAGATQTRLLTFVAYDLIGASLWAGVAVVLGVLFRDAIDQVLDTLASLGRWGGVLVAALVAVYVLTRWWKRRLLLRQLRMDRISVAQLAALIDAGTPPLILDVRPALQREREAGIPGAVAVDLDAQDMPPVPADREVVVYCACPNEASAALVARKLMRKGFRRVRPLQDGVDGWIAFRQENAPAASPAG